MQNHQKPPRLPPLPPPQTTPTSHSHSNSDESPHTIDNLSLSNSDESPHTIDDHSLNNSDESPHLIDDHTTNTTTAIVAVEKYYSPLTSPLPLTPPNDTTTTPHNFSSNTPYYNHHQFNRSQNFSPPEVPAGAVVYGGETKGRRFGGGGDNELSCGGGESVVDKVNLGVRVLEFVFCLVSFSVMAADKTQGWSGDSFDRHKEYRFCLSVSVLGFLYAAFQAYDVGIHFATGKYMIRHHLRYHFVFIMDQILAYLLISASSAAASRVDDWQSNWGKDEFTNKASASVSMAFLAFLGFAITSLISGYNLCNRHSS